jgi:hypothetical protein
MLCLFQNTIDPYLFYKHCSLRLSVGKELGKNYKVRIDFSSLTDHVSCYKNGGTMQIVHSEPIKVLGHFSYVLQHIFPSCWGVLGFISITDSNQITPYIYSSS